MSGSLVLRTGDAGDAVRDLQHRLAGAGFTVSPSEIGTFGSSTDAAVRAFQAHRSIRVDGAVGRETWSALVESGFELGDRLLYLRSPNLRGDDVAELQHTLNRLGFDAGREDGILGPDTAGALAEFQRNSGLSVDGIAGPATLDAFARVAMMAAGSVASVRERDQLRRPPLLGGRRIYLAVQPGFDQIGTPLLGELTRAGAQVMPDLSGADDHELAGRANRWLADLFLAIRHGDHPTWQCRYFASGSFRSERGYHAAALMGQELDRELGPSGPDAVLGCAYSVLRETRMAAVVCALGDADAATVAAIMGRSAEISAALAGAIRRSFEEPSTEP